MTQLFAQPYDVSATGFYFETAEDYADKVSTVRNDCGGPVEEFEIQFIDGEDLDAALAKTWGLNQANFSPFLDAADEWSDVHKTRYIIAVGECGYCHEQVADDPDQIDMTVYELSSMKELAEQFVDEGLFGEIPQALQNYIDHEAIARDLSDDYSETEIGGTRLIFHCA